MLIARTAVRVFLHIIKILLHQTPQKVESYYFPFIKILLNGSMNYCITKTIPRGTFFIELILFFLNSIFL